MTLQDLTLNPQLLSIQRYVAGKSIAELQRELGLSDIVKLGSNENPFGPSPKAIEAVIRAASEMHYYPSVEVFDLRAKLAESLGGGMDADNVIVGNGSADIIRILAQALLHGGGEVIVSRPAFQMYEMVTTMYGGRTIFLEAENYRYNLQAMADKITDRTRMVFICNPNNPTGLMVTQSDVDALMDRVPRHVVVVFDQAYCEYADAPDYPDTLRYVREGRNVISTRTFSKIYGLAGMRVGYGVAGRELVGYLLRTQPAFHSGRIALLAALASLEDEEYKRRTQQANAQGRAYLCSQFDRMGLRYLPSQANFIMLIDLPHDVNAIDRALLQRGIILRPTAPFGIPQALRATIGTPEQNVRVIEALESVLTELGRQA